ncbi:cysteine desulfurase NifS [bacterium]|nr:cysteine desulfurase NifS [bacterium]
MNLIYLDNNATTKVDDKVIKVMMPYFGEKYGNASSMYEFARSASDAIKAAREQMKYFYNAENEKEIIFTSCGSESANLAIRGMLNMNKNKRHIITTKVEHPCVLNLYKQLEKEGYKADYIGVNSNGELNLEELDEKVNSDTALVSVMYANNETGVIFPIKKIVEIVKAKNPETKVFSDGVQAAGKINIDVQDLGVDAMGVSGHKFHAPKGVGALYVNSKTLITPLIIGGHQERGKRAGTENVPYIAGMGLAAEMAKDALKYESTEVKRLRDKLESGIIKRIYNARVNAGINNRVPNTTNIGFEYIEGELILLHLSDIGICASSGSACTSGSLEPSHVLRALNVPFTSIHGSIRFSLSRFTKEKEIDYVIEKLPPIIEKLCAISPYQDELNALKKLKGF